MPRVGADPRLRPSSPSSSSPLASTRPSRTCASDAPCEVVSGRDGAQPQPATPLRQRAPPLAAGAGSPALPRPPRAASYRCCAAAPVQQETLGASPSPDLSLPLPSRLGSGAVPVRGALDAAGSNAAPARGAVNAPVGRRSGPAMAASAARAPCTDAAAPSAVRPRLHRHRPR